MALEVQEAGVGVGEGVSVMIKIVLLGLDFFSLRLKPGSCKLEGLSFLREGFMYKRWYCLGANKHQTAPEKSV